MNWFLLLWCVWFSEGVVFVSSVSICLLLQHGSLECVWCASLVTSQVWGVFCGFRSGAPLFFLIRVWKEMCVVECGVCDDQ